MTDLWHYPRLALAEQVIHVFESGLSHALTFFAPRRKGKTEFLLKDIKPLAEQKGWNVFYFSFLDVSDNIEQRFIYNLQHFAQSKVRKVLGHVASVELYGVKAEFKQVQYQDLLDSIHVLAEQNTPCLLLLDEIQALASQQHYAIIASLRTALDTHKDNIKVIFTGSSRENLRLMFSSSKAPFFHYGQNLSFPDLGRGFTDHLAELYHKTTMRMINSDDLWQCFIDMNRSPQLARSLIERMALNIGMDLASAKQQLLAETVQQREFSPIYYGLSALQQLLLKAIAYGEKELYSQTVKQNLALSLGIESVQTPIIQSSLRTLSKKNMIFKVDNGHYEIEDELFKDWLLEQA